MNLWKTVLVLVTSFVLVGAQTVFAFGHKVPTQAASQKCSCCSCQQLNCCIAQPVPAPEPVPATPARAISQTNLQLALALVAVLLKTPESSAAPVAFPPLRCPVVAAVPIYDWNCSYLI